MKVIPLIHSLKSEECFEIVVQETLVGSDHAFSACVGSNAAGSGEGLGELGKDWRARNRPDNSIMNKHVSSFILPLPVPSSVALIHTQFFELL